MPNKKPPKTVIAICVQEISEDGSNLELDSRFNDKHVRFLSQSFTADTLVSALSAPDVAVRLFFSSNPDTVASVKTILAYLRSREGNEKLSGIDNGNFKEVELPAKRWGIKMEEAFKSCFDEGFDRVIFLGSRSPTVKVDMLVQAIRELESHDAVFGPTVEGRYYLLGMNGKYHTSMAQFDWTLPSLYSDVSSAMTRMGIDWTEMPIWYVVEHPEDLEYLVRDINQFRVEGDEVTAHETEKALQRIFPELE